MFGNFNKILDMLTLDALKGISINKRLELVKPKPKSMEIVLRIEKLSGKCILEKENDLVLRNLVRVLYHFFANNENYSNPSITVTDVTGASYSGYIGRSSNPGIYTAKYLLGWYYAGSVGDVNSGIVIGNGTTPPSRTDYAIQSKIPHGTGTGQIYYQQQSYELLSDYQFRLTREFTNAGSDLSVSEAGLIYSTIITDNARSLLLLRDTFTPISVTAGNGVRVRYTFSF
jgi:hypothetical protein